MNLVFRLPVVGAVPPSSSSVDTSSVSLLFDDDDDEDRGRDVEVTGSLDAAFEMFLVCWSPGVVFAAGLSCVPWSRGRS